MFEQHDACCSSADEEFSCTPDELQDVNKSFNTLCVFSFQKQKVAQKRYSEEKLNDIHSKI